MAVYHLVALLSAIALIATLNIAEGRSSHRHTNSENARERSRTDAKKEVRERTQTFLENFKNRLEEYRNESSEENSADSNEDRRWDENFRKTIKEHIVNAIKDRIKDKINSKTASASSSKGSAAEAVHVREDNEKDKDKSDHDTCDDNSSDNSASSSDKDKSVSEDDDDDSKEVGHIIHDITEAVKDIKSRAIRKLVNSRKFIRSRLQTKLNLIRDALRKYAVNDNDDDDDDDDSDSDSSSEEGSENNRQSDTDKDTEITFEEIIEDVYRRLNVTHRFNVSDAYQKFLNTVWETFGSDIERLNSTRQEFLEAKAEMIEAADELHNYKPGPEGRRSRFQLLPNFRSKLRVMLSKKQQYVREKVRLVREIREYIRELILSYHWGYFTTTEGFESQTTAQEPYTTDGPEHHGRTEERTNSSSDVSKGDEFQGTTGKEEQETPEYFWPTTTEETDLSSNVSANHSHYSGLRLAVGYRGANSNDDDDDDGGDGDSSAVVVLIVIACLVATATVVVIGAVTWKRQRRHRLYARIPSQHESL